MATAADRARFRQDALDRQRDPEVGAQNTFARQRAAWAFKGRLHAIRPICVNECAHLLPDIGWRCACYWCLTVRHGTVTHGGR